MAEAERVQKLLARAGFGSRRACEEFIRQKRVTVNGKLITLGARADPDTDIVELDGERVEIRPDFTYVMLHKPRGVVSTVVAQPQENRPTVCDLVDLPGHLVPVGRLDVESEGLILLTDDGDLTNVLTHPRYGHTKTYRVLVANRPGEETLSTMRRGVVLPDGTKSRRCKVSIVRVEKDQTWLRIVLTEGRKRQIREMGAVLGHPVKYIIRTQLGPLKLGDLKPGEWRHLTEQEVAALKRIKKQAQRKARGRTQGTKGKRKRSKRRR